MEMQDLAKKLGVRNIIVSHINDGYYKDNITIIVNDYLLVSFIGKTYTTIPLTKDGIDKDINSGALRKIIDRIKKELADQKF